MIKLADKCGLGVWECDCILLKMQSDFSTGHYSGDASQHSTKAPHQRIKQGRLPVAISLMLESKHRLWLWHLWSKTRFACGQKTLITPYQLIKNCLWCTFVDQSSCFSFQSVWNVSRHRGNSWHCVPGYNVCSFRYADCINLPKMPRCYCGF